MTAATVCFAVAVSAAVVGQPSEPPLGPTPEPSAFPPAVAAPASTSSMTEGRPSEPRQTRRPRRRRPPPRPARPRPARRVAPDAGVHDEWIHPPLDAGLSAAPAPTAEPVPLAPPPAAKPVQRVWEELGDTVSIFVPTHRLRSLTDPLLLLSLIALGLMVSVVAGRARPRLARRGALPRLAEFLHVSGRFAAVVLLGILVVRAAPSWLRPALPWVLLSAAVAVGWSARDLLPDLIAGAVVRLERRIRTGQWVVGDGFDGIVHRVGLRATWLEDPLGRSVSVPNRALLAGPVVLSADAGATHTARLRLPRRDTSSAYARRAIVAAAASSPCVILGDPPTAYRDPEAPDVWRVTVRLRRRGDAVRFDGELASRATAYLLEAHRRLGDEIDGSDAE